MHGSTLTKMTRVKPGTHAASAGWTRIRRTLYLQVPDGTLIVAGVAVVTAHPAAVVMVTGEPAALIDRTRPD